MRRLYISIIVSVLGSLFIIGWGLDYFVADTGQEKENAEIVLYKNLIEGFRQQLSILPNRDLTKATQQLEALYQLNLNIEAIDNIALPNELILELSNPGGLFLASDTEAYLLRKIDNHPYVLLQLHIPPDPVENQQLDIFLTIILYLGVCSIIILWLLPLTRRLYLLNAAAQKIGEGDLNVRMPSSKYSYIHVLEQGFNRMADQIEKLVEDNKILARSLSHDIRTPMACLRFGIEAAMDTTNLTKKDAYLVRIDDELTRMEDMTQAFLEYAGLERQGFDLRIKDVDVNELATAVTHDLQTLAEQYKVKLTCKLSNKIVSCPLDIHWCHRALQNLISNAVQYANHQVILSVNTTATHLEIGIGDDGKGIPEDKLNVIFKPFVKLDSDRSREQGHFGLGLAITAKVVDWHHGEIIATRSSSLSGAHFILKFPL
jgi:signal transduction histidine kinase